MRINNKRVDEYFDKNLILFSKNNYKNKLIKNISVQQFETLSCALKKFNSEALIVRPDRYILSSYAGDNIADFVDKVLSSVYN